jgi:hypothetical protein
LPWANTQVGFTVERNLATLGPQNIPDSRAVVYGRYVLMYGDSLYLQPFHFVEAFGVVQNRDLPTPRFPVPGADLFNTRPALGAHYHLNLLTPYWDAEGGALVDLTFQEGLPIFGNEHSFQEVYGQFSTVKYMPKVFDWLSDGPVVHWLDETRWAFRIGGAMGLPSNGELFALGGGNLFRGFDQGHRQGNAFWVGSVEWRVPLLRNLDWDYFDHVAGLRNAYLAPFYDVGNAYLNEHAEGSTAHALGIGVRLDVVWLGVIERTMLRFDVARAINTNAPVQFWFGIEHPF